jgi:hypothetical protein
MIKIKNRIIDPQNYDAIMAVLLKIIIIKNLLQREVLGPAANKRYKRRLLNNRYRQFSD